MKKLVIIGAGGFGKEVAWLVEEINCSKPEWELVGFIDDNLKQGEIINGIPVIGDVQYLSQFEKQIHAVCAMANPVYKKSVLRVLSGNDRIVFPNLTHPSIRISRTNQIGVGNILCKGTILTVNITIGNHVVIDVASTIGHDAVIRDYATILPAVNVSGCCVLHEGVTVGTGTQIIQGLSVGENTVLGAGSVVVKNIPANCTAVGVPAKPIKVHEQQNSLIG